MGVSIFDEKAAIVTGTNFAGAALATPQTITPFAQWNMRLDKLIVSSNDVIAHELTLEVRNDGAPAIVGTVHIPAGAGYSAANPAIDLITQLPVLGDGLNFYNGGAFWVSDPVAITLTFHITILSVGGLI